MSIFTVSNLLGEFLSSAMLIGNVTPKIWYGAPLVVVISLVYGATRHEYLKEITVHAMRSALWILGFMAIIFVVIWLGGFFI